MKECNWVEEIVKTKQVITADEIHIHAKNCPICQEEAKRKLKRVKFSIPLEKVYGDEWYEPKCPFCFSEVKKPQGRATKKCGKCGALYFYDPTCDIEAANEIIDELESEGKLSEDQGVDFYTYHNYAIEAHAFNRHLSPIDDVQLPLAHLMFVRVQDGKYQLPNEPVQNESKLKEILTLLQRTIEIQEKTRPAFKSKLIAETRAETEKAVNMLKELIEG